MQVLVHQIVYDFIYKYIDLSKIIFIEGNTDSLYTKRSQETLMKIVTKENVYKWFPNPTIPKKEQSRDQKKLLGVSFEIALK
jgi:hypothetical protein